MAESKSNAPWKVLLVDDEQSALQMYSALLREDGIPVLTAATFFTRSPALCLPTRSFVTPQAKATLPSVTEASSTTPLCSLPDGYGNISRQ